MKTALFIALLAIIAGGLTINHINKALDANRDVFRHNPALAEVMTGFDNTSYYTASMSVVTNNDMQPFKPSVEDDYTASDAVQPASHDDGQVTQNWLFIQDATAHIQGSSNE